MPRLLTPEAAEAILARETGEAFLALLQISGPGLTTMRVVNNVEAITRNGQVYQPWAFDGAMSREFVHTTEAGCDADETARHCLLAVLGEPNTLMLAPSVDASYSIRVAIDHAQNVGPVDVGGML